MQETFGIVVFAVVGIGAIVAVLTFVTSGREYDRIGRGGMSLGDDDGLRPREGGVGTPTSEAERLEEIRQFLDARNRRRVARGEAPVDVEAELAELVRPAVDPGIAGEIRELVEARNARRIRRGEAPLDVDAEVARRLSELEDDGAA